MSALSENQQIFQAQTLQTLEKCALALELVGRLRKEGLDFIFKGGGPIKLIDGIARNFENYFKSGSDALKLTPDPAVKLFCKQAFTSRPQAFVTSIRHVASLASAQSLPLVLPQHDELGTVCP